MGSGMLLNVKGVDIGRISSVLLTIARVMSLKEAAGPNSVPPILSTINFDTVLM